MYQPLSWSGMPILPLLLGVRHRSDQHTRHHPRQLDDSEAAMQMPSVASGRVRSGRNKKTT